MADSSAPGAGACGEIIAAAFLESRGYRVVERNLRIAGSELDLVARRGEWTVFVEVKWRRNDPAEGAGSQAWRAAQRARCNRAALAYLAERGSMDAGSWRFDLILIVEHAAGLELTHHRGAWAPGRSFW